MSPGVLEELASQLRALGDSQRVGWGHTVLPDPRRALLGHLGLRSSPGCAHSPGKEAEGPSDLEEGREVGSHPRLTSPFSLLGSALPQDSSSPKGDVCCFPILRHAPRLFAPLGQGSAAWVLLSRHGLVRCSSQPMSSSCRAFSSRSHSASSHCCAPPGSGPGPAPGTSSDTPCVPCHSPATGLQTGPRAPLQPSSAFFSAPDSSWVICGHAWLERRSLAKSKLLRNRK